MRRIWPSCVGWGLRSKIKSQSRCNAAKQGSLMNKNASSVRRLRKAVLPVAGLGTRVLPATKAIPKEMLPVFDRPAIQYVVDEALAAGIDHIVFVTGPN